MISEGTRSRRSFLSPDTPTCGGHRPAAAQPQTTLGNAALVGFAAQPDTGGGTGSVQRRQRRRGVCHKTQLQCRRRGCKHHRFVIHDVGELCRLPCGVAATRRGGGVARPQNHLERCGRQVAAAETVSWNKESDLCLLCRHQCKILRQALKDNTTHPPSTAKNTPPLVLVLTGH